MEIIIIPAQESCQEEEEKKQVVHSWLMNYLSLLSWAVTPGSMSAPGPFRVVPRWPLLKVQIKYQGFS